MAAIDPVVASRAAILIVLDAAISKGGRGGEQGEAKSAHLKILAAANNGLNSAALAASAMHQATIPRRKISLLTQR